MSFMRSNPFTSPVGQRIEKATSETQASEDWGLIMEITDIINETEEGAKDAVKALKKRLFNSKKWKEVIFSLTVLETCVKNCQHRFHVLICKQEFCKELVKVIHPNFNPPTVVQEKILSLIQSWADAFKGDASLQGVVKVYEELKSKSIEFPPTDLDALSPIRTPQRITPEIDPGMNRPAAAPTLQPTQPMAGNVPVSAIPQQPPSTQQQTASPQPPGVSADQMNKLRQELDMVLGNVRVMSEMLTEMTPGQENPDDLSLLQELNDTCRVMQKRVVELLSNVSHEEVTGELLRVNDDLNNMFVRYDRFERYRQSQAQATQPTQPTQPPTMAALPPTAQGDASTGTLIDFGSDDPAPAYPTPGPAVAPMAAMTGPPYPTLPPAVGSMSAMTGPPPYPTPPPAVAPMAAPTVAPYPSQVPTYRSPPYSVNDTAPNTAPLTDQLAGLSVTGGSVSNTLGQINTVPMSANPPPPDDDFDMFAQSRQTSYQDSRRTGSTYQDNTNLDQADGALAGYVQNRAHPYTAGGAPPTQRAPTTGTGGLDEVEQWLTASDLSKPQDSLAAVNTNPTDQGITSSEFDNFLQERARFADTLPTTDIGGHSNVMAPASNPQNRQMQMNEAENSMFAL